LAVSSYFSLKFPETLIGKKARLMEASFPSNYRAQANAHLGPERTLTQAKSLAQLPDLGRRERLVLRAERRAISAHGLGPFCPYLV
jgi:hypothetical protein